MASKAKPLPPLEELERLFSYDSKTGVISRLVKVNRNTILGPVYPTKQYKPNGDKKYFQIAITNPETGKTEKYYYHRVAWKLYTGEDPPDKLDHRDGDVWNTRIKNLRKATTSSNGFNRGMQRNNSVGFKGVYQREGRTGFYAKITTRGEVRYLGRFATAELASRAYKQAARKLHTRYAHESAYD